MPIRNGIDTKIGEIRRLVRDLNWQCAELRPPIHLNDSASQFFTPAMFEIMNRVAKKVLLLAALTISQRHEGHLASTASALHIMTAIYFSRARDWLEYAGGKTDKLLYHFESHKPHAVPGWYGLLYLEGLLQLEQLKAFRTFKGLNAYPTHEDPGIQIPTGSLGLGPVSAIGLAFLDEYHADHGSLPTRGLQISIVGDSEFDEGVILESIKERASRRITGWLEIIDYNRQSLDGNLDERLVDRITALYEAHGIPVIILKYGMLLQELFDQGKPGAELRRRLDLMTTDDYQALLRQPGDVIRNILTMQHKDFDTFLREGMRSISEFLNELAHSGGQPDRELVALTAGKTDEQIKEVFANLGGHDLPMLVAALEKVKKEGGGAAIIAYTIKGWGVRDLLGDLSSHWTQVTPRQIAGLARSLGLDTASTADLWNRFPPKDPASRIFGRIAKARKRYDKALGKSVKGGREKLKAALTNKKGLWAIDAESLTPDGFDPKEPISTQAYLGSLFGSLARADQKGVLSLLADCIVTMAADVAYTAGLKNWINARGVWGPPAVVDVVRKYGAAPEMNVTPRRDGQHIRLSNLEQFLALLAASFGKSADFTGARLFPFAFFYDVFLERFSEMFKYGAYWDSAVWFVGTIAGASAPGESGLHHGLTSGMIGRMTPNSITWEPTFPLELNWILDEEFRRAVVGEDHGRRVRYLRTTATSVTQQDMLNLLKIQARFRRRSDRSIYNSIRKDVLAGGYRLIDHHRALRYAPGSNVVNVFTIGTTTQQAIKASQRLEKEKIFANVIVATSPDLLIDHPENDHLLRLVRDDERAEYTPLILVADSHPMYLAGIASRLAVGRCKPREVSLCVSGFDRSGTPEEILAFHRMNADSIIEAAHSLLNVR